MREHIAKLCTISLLLLLAACNLSTASQPPAATPAPVVTAEPTQQAATTTYTNTAFAYTIEIPASVEFRGVAANVDVWIDRQIYITAYEANPEEPRGDAPVIESASDAMIGSFTARRLSGYVGAVGGNTPQRYESIVIQHNNLYYQIIAYELKNDDVQPVDRAMNPVPPETLVLLDQIVASLRFVN
jgi:hypothetical protein